MNIDKNTSALVRQFIALAEQGLTPEQICEALSNIEGLTPEFVSLAIQGSTTTKKVDLSQKLDSLGAEMIDILADIARNPEANDMARARCCEIIVTKRGQLPVFDDDSVAAMFKKMNELKQLNSEKIVKLEQSKAA